MPSPDSALGLKTVYVPGLNAGETDAPVSKGTVTQATNLTTAVTLNTRAGTITTVAPTVGTLDTVTFTVNNSLVEADSCVLVSMVEWNGLTDGTDGMPYVAVGAVANGSFTVDVMNAHATVALNAASTTATMKVSFLVL